MPLRFTSFVSEPAGQAAKPQKKQKNDNPTLRTDPLGERQTEKPIAYAATARSLQIGYGYPGGATRGRDVERDGQSAWDGKDRHPAHGFGMARFLGDLLEKKKKLESVRGRCWRSVGTSRDCGTEADPAAIT